MIQSFICNRQEDIDKPNDEQLNYLQMYMQEHPDVANPSWTDVAGYWDYQVKIDELAVILNSLGPLQNTSDRWNAVKISG